MDNRIDKKQSLVKNYSCPHCNRTLLTAIPTDNETWEMFVQCNKCNKYHKLFRRHGEIAVFKMESEQEH